VDGIGGKFGAAVACVFDDVVLNGELSFLVGVDHAVGLVDFDLGVSFSVEEVEGGRVLVEVEGGAGELCELGVFVGSGAEEFMDNGAGSVAGAGLGFGAKDEVSGAKVVDDGLYGAVLVEVVA